MGQGKRRDGRRKGRNRRLKGVTARKGAWPREEGGVAAGRVHRVVVKGQNVTPRTQQQCFGRTVERSDTGLRHGVFINSDKTNPHLRVCH